MNKRGVQEEGLGLGDERRGLRRTPLRSSRMESGTYMTLHAWAAYTPNTDTPPSRELEGSPIRHPCVFPGYLRGAPAFFVPPRGLAWTSSAGKQLHSFHCPGRKPAEAPDTSRHQKPPTLTSFEGTPPPPPPVWFSSHSNSGVGALGRLGPLPLPSLWSSAPGADPTHYSPVSWTMRLLVRTAVRSP